MNLYIRKYLKNPPMKKIVLMVIILLAGPIGMSQNSKKIIGKWAFADLYEKEKMDAESIEMTNMLFKDFAINFREDGTMTLMMLKKNENGQYKFDPANDNQFAIISASGKSKDATIVKIDDKQMIVSLGDTGAMVLNKVSNTPDTIVIKPITPKVSATFQQVLGKWNLVDMEKEKKSEFFYELIKGSYIEFFKDNTYRTKILSFEENGVWELAQGNTVIDIETAEDKGFWNILQISPTDLTMQRGPEGKKYTFKKALE